MVKFKAAHGRWFDVYDDGNQKLGAVAANLEASHPMGTWRVFSRKLGVGWKGFSTQSFQTALQACKHLLELHKHLK